MRKPSWWMTTLCQSQHFRDLYHQSSCPNNQVRIGTAINFWWYGISVKYLSHEFKQNTLTNDMEIFSDLQGKGHIEENKSWFSRTQRKNGARQCSFMSATKYNHYASDFFCASSSPMKSHPEIWTVDTGGIGGRRDNYVSSRTTSFRAADDKDRTCNSHNDILVPYPKGGDYCDPPYAQIVDCHLSGLPSGTARPGDEKI